MNDIKEIVVAILRLLVALALMWLSVANAAGIDVLAFMEVLKYALEHPEVLAAAIAAAYAWWKNENITEEARMAQSYLKLWKSQRDMAGGEEDMSMDPDDPEDDDGPEEDDDDVVMEEE